jgi:hypothetical protein
MHLRQEAAVNGGPSLEQNVGLGQNDTLHVCTHAHVDLARDLPEDILRINTTQDDLCAPDLLQRTGNLKDEDISRTAREGDVIADGNVSVELVDAGCQRTDCAAVDTTKDSGTVIEMIWSAPRGVGVRVLHVADSSSQLHRSGYGIVRREGLACDLGRFRKHISRVRGQAEAGHGGCGDGRDGDVSGDFRIWYGGDTGRCEDHVVFGTQERDRVLRGSRSVKGGGDHEDELESLGSEHHCVVWRACENMRERKFDREDRDL